MAVVTGASQRRLDCWRRRDFSCCSGICPFDFWKLHDDERNQYCEEYCRDGVSKGHEPTAAGDLFGDNASLRHVLVEMAEVVAARAQWRQVRGCLFARRDSLLAVELETFEFVRLLAGVDDPDGQRLTGRDG